MSVTRSHRIDVSILNSERELIVCFLVPSPMNACLLPFQNEEWKNNRFRYLVESIYSLSGAGSYRMLYMCVSAVAFVNAMTFSILGPFFPEYASSRFGSTSTQVRGYHGRLAGSSRRCHRRSLVCDLRTGTVVVTLTRASSLGRSCCLAIYRSRSWSPRGTRLGCSRAGVVVLLVSISFSQRNSRKPCREPTMI